jgi:hypothetical protein
MNLDKTSFVLALGTLAAGGAGGYFAKDRNLVAPALAPAPSATAATVASAAASSSAPTPPPCDDMAGAPAECPPPPYSADESGCAPIATKRCEDFKQSMKPRIAERAVACVLSLSPAQRCDPARVNLCGHAALMNACVSPADAPSNGGSSTDDVAARCRAIVQSCPAASLRDCEATLAGMTAVGRDRMNRCMSTHCADKGLLGCEGVDDERNQRR